MDIVASQNSDKLKTFTSLPLKTNNSIKAMQCGQCIDSIRTLYSQSGTLIKRAQVYGLVPIIQCNKQACKE